jgi:hypothetical protein
MVQQLSDEPETVFCDLLRDNWDSTDTLGYDPTLDDTSKDAQFDIQTSLDKVGRVYPHITVTFSDQTTPGETGFTFMGTNGPGRQPRGTCLATVRAEAAGGGYVGDSNSYTAVDADGLVRLFRQEVERVCRANPLGGASDFTTVAPRRSGDIPDDDDPAVGDVVRQSQVTLLYSFTQEPA